MSMPQYTRKSSPWRLRVRERRIVVGLGDFFVAGFALAIGTLVWFNAQDQSYSLIEFFIQRLPYWYKLLPFIWLLLLIESYDHRIITHTGRTIRAIFIAVSAAMVLYLALFFLLDTALPRIGVAVFLGINTILTLAWRLIALKLFTAPRFMHRVLIIGAGKAGEDFLDIVQDLWPPPFYVVGFVDDDPAKLGIEVKGFPVLGGCDVLMELIDQQGINDVIVAITGRLEPVAFRSLIEAHEKGVEITRMPVAYEELLSRVPVQHLETDWILRSFVDETRESTFYAFASRLLDIVGGIVGILLLLIMGPFIVLAIFIESGRPIIFKQVRAGKGGKEFEIYKFRSMRQDAEEEGSPVLAEENDERATKVGKILRRTHLDEWLQFINVLRGDMTLVGPRPERPELVAELSEQIPFFRARLLVKPGIAGWAQVNVSYFATMEEMLEKLEYDLYYIKHRNLFMDIMILIRTVATVIGFRGR